MRAHLVKLLCFEFEGIEGIPILRRIVVGGHGAGIGADKWAEVAEPSRKDEALRRALRSQTAVANREEGGCK